MTSHLRSTPFQAPVAPWVPRWRRPFDGAMETLLDHPWAARLHEWLSAAPVSLWRERILVPGSLGRSGRLRIAFASDLHAGPLTPIGTLRRACAALMVETPDLILLGGDFVGTQADQAQRLRPLLSDLWAPLGVYGVLGNHDHSCGPRAIAAVLAGAGVRLLVNDGLRLPPPFENTFLAGLDDHTAGRPAASRIPWQPECTTIVLMHQPSGLLDLDGRRFDVALAGHTHGGQITLPGGHAPVVPCGALSRPFLSGRFAAGGGQLLVSVGVGNTLLPFRIGPRPQVLLCELIGAEGDSQASKGPG